MLTPDSLLVDPCKAVSAGDTVRSLAKAYVSDTSCIGQYALLLQKQREQKAAQILLYSPKNK